MARWENICWIFIFLCAATSSDDTVDLDNSILQIFHNCICVRYYQCDDDNYIITDGAGLFTIRSGDDVNTTNRIICKGGKVPGDQVCCKERSSEAILTPKNPDTFIEVDSENKKVTCGRQKTVINVRIFGPDENELVPVAGEFPWIAAIFKKDNDGQYKFHSSGSLIHPKVILTANHYVHRQQADKFKVVVNGQIELPTIGNNTEEERNIVEIVHHAGYNPSSLYNDVALLILDEPYVEGKNFLNRICLPPKNMTMDGLRCIVAGWGKEPKETAGPKILKKVEVPYVENSTCQDLLRRTRLGSAFKLHKSFVCAGGEKGKDACTGDGGSPLMCPYSPGESRYLQVGIVAWGVGCGTENVPGVYGNVKEFKKWIDNELRKRNLDKD